MQSLSHLVRDYWDAGTAAASATILSHTGNQFYSNIFGESYASLSIRQKLQIAAAGIFTSMVGAGIRDSGSVKSYLRNLFKMDSQYDTSSSLRNFNIVLSTILIGIDLGVESNFLEEAVMKAVDALFIYGSVSMDRSRIRNANGIGSKSLRSNDVPQN